MLLAGVADDSPGGVDAARKRRLRDDPPAPDRRQQIVLADDAAAIFDQEYQEIENLRFHRQQRGSPTPLAAFGVENEIFEQERNYVADTPSSPCFRETDSSTSSECNGPNASGPTDPASGYADIRTRIRLPPAR